MQQQQVAFHRASSSHTIPTSATKHSNSEQRSPRLGIELWVIFQKMRDTQPCTGSSIKTTFNHSSSCSSSEIPTSTIFHVAMELSFAPLESKQSVLFLSAMPDLRDTSIPDLVNVCGEAFTQTSLVMNLNSQSQTLRTALQDLLFFPTRLHPL